MLRIRLSELSAADRERLRAEVVATLATDATFPPFVEYRSGRLLARPVSKVEQRQAHEFVAALPLADDTLDITSSALVDRLATAMTRYSQTSRQPVTAQLAERSAADIQRRLVAYVIDGVGNGFGETDTTAPTWRTVSAGAAPALPWEAVAERTSTLALALARTRDEAPPTPARPVVPTVSDVATERLPTLERSRLPPPIQEYPASQLTAPLPKSVELPPPAEPNRNDQVIFTQLRQQLLDAMRRAAQNYRITAPVDDPAGLLHTLRQRDAIDDGDLRLAEGILALCGRVITAGRANLDDFREALTLYLLFHRGKFNQAMKGS